MGFSHWLKNATKKVGHFAGDVAQGFVDEVNTIGGGIGHLAETAIDKAGDVVQTGEKEVGKVVKAGEDIVGGGLQTLEGAFTSFTSIPLLLAGGFVLFMLMNPGEFGKTTRSVTSSSKEGAAKLGEAGMAAAPLAL